MTIQLGNYKFSGPYFSCSKLKNKAGLYTVHCFKNGAYRLLDIGESATIKSRITNHERMKCWQINCSGKIAVSVYYTPHWSQQGRMKLQKKLRDRYQPPCGKKIDGKLNFIIDNS